MWELRAKTASETNSALGDETSGTASASNSACPREAPDTSAGSIPIHTSSPFGESTFSASTLRAVCVLPSPGPPWTTVSRCCQRPSRARRSLGRSTAHGGTTAGANRNARGIRGGPSETARSLPDGLPFALVNGDVRRCFRACSHRPQGVRQEPHRDRWRSRRAIHGSDNAVFGALPDAGLRVVDQIAEGDLVADANRGDGHTPGATRSHGISPTGAPVRTTAMAMHRVLAGAGRRGLDDPRRRRPPARSECPILKGEPPCKRSPRPLSPVSSPRSTRVLFSGRGSLSAWPFVSRCLLRSPSWRSQ